MSEQVSESRRIPWKGAAGSRGRFKDHPQAAERPLEQRAIVAAKAGDWGAVHFLFVRYVDSVRDCAFAVLKNHHDAEDVAQSVFARLPDAITRYEQREVAFGAWLARVARNAAIDYLRAKRQLPDDQIELHDFGEQQNDAARRRVLSDAFDQLSGDQRSVLLLRHVVGLSLAEIADRLGKSESAIHGLHHRGRGALQLILREHDVAPVVRATA